MTEADRTTPCDGVHSPRAAPAPPALHTLHTLHIALVGPLPPPAGGIANQTAQPVSYTHLTLPTNREV